MWIDVTTGDIARTHSDVRALRPNWSAPSVLTDGMVEEAGFTLVSLTPAPDATEYQDVIENGVVVDGNVWKLVWKIVDWDQTRIDEFSAAKEATNRKEMSDYLTTVRELREKLLNRISGIATAALCTADQVTVDAYVVARQRLLDMTKVPAALAATNQIELEAAIKTEYASIVAATAPSLRAAFYLVEA